MSSSISSFRRFTLAFAAVFCISAVLFVAGTEALIRVYVAPRDEFNARKQAFRNGTETAAAFGDSRVVSGIAGGDGLANFADTGADLDTILGKLDAYVAMGRGRRIVLQLAPQHFALYRLNDDQKDRLEEFLEPGTPMLQFLRPHYRRYLFDYWSAVIRDPKLPQARKPVEKGVGTTLVDRAPETKRKQAQIRVQLHIPVAGYAATKDMNRLRAALERAQAAGANLCLVGFPVGEIYREVAGKFPVFSEIRAFYKALAGRLGAPYLDLWGAYDDRYFSNVDHLNDAGARRLTREIKRRCLT